MGQKKNAFENQLDVDDPKQGKYSTSEMRQMEKSTKTRTNVQVHGGEKSTKTSTEQCTENRTKGCTKRSVLKMEQKNMEVHQNLIKHRSASKREHTEKCLKLRTKR